MRQQRDPVEHVRKLLIDNKLAEAGELKAIEKVGNGSWPAVAAGLGWGGFCSTDVLCTAVLRCAAKLRPACGPAYCGMLL